MMFFLKKKSSAIRKRSFKIYHIVEFAAEITLGLAMMRILPFVEYFTDKKKPIICTSI